MRSVKHVRSAAILVMLGVIAATGCQTDREQILIGKWKGDAMSATFAAIKMKEDSGASQQDAENAAKLLAATYIDLKKDKIFTAGMGGATAEGGWTFNKETGEVILNIAKMIGPNQQEMPGAKGSWTAYLNDDNRRLSFYPAPPESVAIIKNAKATGGMSGGISLFKQ